MSNKNKTTVLKVLIERVHSLKNGGKLNEAIRTAQTAVDTARRLIETDPDQALNLITSLELFGDLLRESNNYADAESIYIEALEQTKTANCSVLFTISLLFHVNSIFPLVVENTQLTKTQWLKTQAWPDN